MMLTTTQLAEKWALKPHTLEQWRSDGTGPPFRKAGRSVRYDEAEADTWLESRRRTSTSQASAA